MTSHDCAGADSPCYRRGATLRGRVRPADRDCTSARPGGDTAVFRRRPHTRGVGSRVKPGTCTGHSTITGGQRLPITEAGWRAAAARPGQRSRQRSRISGGRRRGVATCCQRGLCLTPPADQQSTDRAGCRHERQVGSKPSRKSRAARRDQRRKSAWSVLGLFFPGDRRDINAPSENPDVSCWETT